MGAASVCCRVKTMARSGSSLGHSLAALAATPPLRAAASSIGMTVDTVRWLAEEKMPILNVSCVQPQHSLETRAKALCFGRHPAL